MPPRRASHLVCSLLLLLPTATAAAPSLVTGLQALWQPGVILSLQLITIGMLFFSGTSTITTGELRFGLAPDWRGQAGCHPESTKDPAPAPESSV